MSLPENLVTPCQTTYRSVGLRRPRVAVRYCTMPLEKVAMIANSSLVSSGSNQLGQAWKIATKEGFLAPYTSVGGLDHRLVSAIQRHGLCVSDGRCGPLCLVTHTTHALRRPAHGAARQNVRHLAWRPPRRLSLAPVTAGTIESVVSNGRRRSASGAWGRARPSSGNWAGALWDGRQAGLRCQFCQKCGHVYHQLRRDAVIVPACLPAGAQVALVVILVWPLREHLRGQRRGHHAVALGSVLNYVEEGGGRNANYRAIMGAGLPQGGPVGVLRSPKWFARVLMNAPIQGTLPRFWPPTSCPRRAGGAAAGGAGPSRLLAQT